MMLNLFKTHMVIVCAEINCITTTIFIVVASEQELNLLS